MSEIAPRIRSKKIVYTCLIIIAAMSAAYVYKCLTDLLYYKSELYGRLERCDIISAYLPNGTSRDFVERMLVESDGAKIEQHNPNSKSPMLDSVIYNLNPWVIWSNDAAYVYIWYDDFNRVIGIDGTCFNVNRNPKGQR